MNEYLQKFLRQLKADNKSERTIKTYEQNISRFFNEIGWNIIALTSEQVEDYKLNMIVDKNLSENSVNLVINSLKSFYNFLKIRKYIENNPLTDVKNLKIPEREKSYMSLEEAQEFLNLVKTKKNINRERNVLLFSLFLHCGLRLSEMANLKKDQLDFENMILTVIGKGNKQRSLPLNTVIEEAFNEYMSVREKINTESEWLFVNGKGEHLSKRRIQGQFYYYIELAKMNPNLSIHSLRHSFATLFSEVGVPIDTLQRLLGHTNISTTQIYSHMSKKKLQEVGTQNPLLDKKIN